MAVTASFPQDHVMPLWQERRHRSSRLSVPNPDTAGIGRPHVARSSATRSWALKRGLDFTAATLALMLFAPLFITIAAAIKITSRGPVLSSQWRYGYRNRRFRIYRIRTMYTVSAIGRHPARYADDPRVTPIGRILRVTSLDELPQLINVVKGNMSLDGPRPHVPQMLAAELLYEALIRTTFSGTGSARHHRSRSGQRLSRQDPAGGRRHCISTTTSNISRPGRCGSTSRLSSRPSGGSSFRDGCLIMYPDTTGKREKSSSRRRQSLARNRSLASSH